MKTLAHAFVSSRLDYCNSLLYGVNDGLLKKLQRVHNAMESESLITSHRYCVNFIGILPVIESHTSWRRLSTSVYMGWRLHIWQTTACLSQLWRVDDTFDLLTEDASLSQEPGLCSAHATLWSLMLLPATVLYRTFALTPSLC